MTVKIKLTCGQGTGRHVGVTADNALKTSPLPARMSGIAPTLLTAQKIYREFFKNDADSKQLNVSASAATPAVFRINSHNDRIVSITEIRVMLNAALMALNSTEIRRFGPAASSPGLTSGLLLSAIQGGVTSPLFLDPVQNIGDFLYWSDSYTNFLDAVNTGIDLLIFNIPLEIPIILPVGSADRLEFSVRDNLTTIDLFNVVAYGSQELVGT